MAVLTYRQARDRLSAKAVQHRVDSGRWQRVHRCVLVTHNGPIGAGERRWVAVLAAGEGAVLAGLSAVDLHGYETTVVHVLIPATRRARSVPAGVVVHRSEILDERDVLLASRPPRTRAARSLVDAAQWAPTDVAARAIIAAGFQQRRVRERDLRDVLDRLPRARRRTLVRQTVADVAGGSDSLAELDFLRLCRAGGLPEPARQVVRRDAAGRRRYLDALFEPWQVHVEIDGGQHREARQAWADMRRQNDLWVAGIRILRFPTWAIRTDPASVTTQLRAALKAAGWPG